MVLYECADTERKAERWDREIEKNTWRRTNLGALGRLLEGDGLLLAHGRNDRNEQILAVVEVGLDLLAHLTLRKLDVVLGGAILGHEVEEAIIDVDLVHHNFVGKYHCETSNGSLQAGIRYGRR